MRTPLRSLVTSLAAVAFGLTLGGAPLAAADLQQFEKVRSDIEADVGRAAEAQVLELLRLAREVHRPFVAGLLVKNFLTKNYKPSGELLQAAAENAVLAGDLDAATTYLKRYLTDAPVNAQSAAAARRLYEIDINLLGRTGDAFQHMVRSDLRFRAGDPSLRRFDMFFIEQAVENRDWAALVMGLDKFMADQPSEGFLHTAIRPAIRRAIAEQGGNASDLVSRLLEMVPRSGMDAKAAAIARFDAAVAAVQPDQDVEAVIKVVLKPATELLKADPRSENLRKALLVIAGEKRGSGWNSKRWEKVRDTVLPWVVEQVGNLPAEERNALRWLKLDGLLIETLGNPRQWLAAGARQPELFAHPDALAYDFDQVFIPDGSVGKQIDAYAKILEGRDMPLALAVRSMQAGSDLASAAKHWFVDTGWRLSGHAAFSGWMRLIEPAVAYKLGGADEKQRATVLDAQRWLETIGKPYMIGTPAVIAAGEYAPKMLAERLWQLPVEQVAGALALLRWMPLDRNQQKKMGDFAKELDRHFGGVANSVRRDKNLSDAKKADLERALGQRGAISAALNAIGERGDASAAPSALTAAYVHLQQSEVGSTAWKDAAATVLKDVSQPRNVPLAFEYFRLLTTRNRRGDAVQDEQAKALALVLSDPAMINEARELVDDFMRARNRWPDRIEKEDREDALAVNAILGEAVKRQIAAGKVDKWLWDLFLNTRQGHQWRETELGADVVAQAIEGGALESIYDGRNEIPAVRAMYLVDKEFPSLQKRFPLVSHFDRQVAQQFKEKQYVDKGYWDYGGKDAQNHVVRAAAAVLATYETVPIVPDAGNYRYGAEDFNRIQHIVYERSAGVLDEDLLLAPMRAFPKRIDAYALGSVRFSNVDLSDNGRRQSFFQALQEYRERAARLPYQIRHPDMNAFGENYHIKQLPAEQLQALISMLREQPFPFWSREAGSVVLVQQLIQTLREGKRFGDLLDLAPVLWRAGSQLGSKEILGDLSAQVRRLAEGGQDELAASLAATGLAVASRGLDDAAKRDLEVVVSGVSAKLGEITVAQTDPRYPIFMAQRNWQVGRSSGAWDSYRTASAGILNKTLDELDPHFTLWILREHIRRSQLVEAETLVRDMLTWLDGLQVDIGAELRAEMLLARADIAFARNEYPIARSQYSYVAESEEFANTRPQLMALLKMADVDRLNKRYDSANAILDKLERRSDSYVRAMAKFYKAQLAVDQERFASASELIEESLDLYEDNSAAQLLRNRILQSMNNFNDAKIIDMGTASLRKKLVPGKPLTIQLKDKQRKLIGRATSVELTVRSQLAGDIETLLLAQAGETGNLFEAVINTAMQPTKQGDKVLQVLGNDTVVFDLSEEFKRRTNYEGPPTEVELRVQSDAELYASSGEIQTREELERMRLRAQIAAIAGISDSAPIGWEDSSAMSISLAESRAKNEIRPGNSFNVMVIDHDRNYTAQLDSVEVTAVTSSGDRIGRVVLNETDSYSGEFTATILTAKRPAYAYASDKQPGHEPNAVISPNKDERLPPWLGSPSHKGPSHFTIDLNDLIEVGTLTARPPTGSLDRTPSSIVVQTSLNNADFKTVGGWPFNFAAWDGKLQVDLVPSGLIGIPGSVTVGRGGNPHQTIIDTFDVTYLDPASGRQRLTPKSGTFVLDYETDLKQAWQEVSKKVGGGGASRGTNRRTASIAQPVSVRMRGLFWIPERTTKTFYVLHELTAPPMLFIDGRQVVGPPLPRGEQAASDQGIPVELTKGLHSLEVVYEVPVDQGSVASVTIKTSISEPPYTAPFGAEMLDLSAAPASVLEDWRRGAVSIQQDPTSRSLQADFGGLPTRVVRLWILEHEGEVPAFGQIGLQAADGTQVLPLAQDYTELLDNDILEIAPGDKITLTYLDPHPYNDNGRDVYEAYLNATYYNGSIQATFARADEKGNESYAEIRRFEPGDTIRVFVRDNDLDITDGEDSITVAVKTSEGKAVTLPLLETGPHTGLFRGTLFPVRGAPTRDSEIQVAVGDDVELSYIDEENTVPGIPWKRSATIEQVVWHEPQFRVYTTTSQPLPVDEVAAAQAAADARTEAGDITGPAVVPQFRLIVERPLDSVPVQGESQPVAGVLGGPLLAEVVWPTVAKSAASSLTIYAQTSSGRAKRAPNSQVAFDIDVPGTIAMTSGPSDPRPAGNLPPGYKDALIVGRDGMLPAMDAGTFGFGIPMALGDLPAYSLATPEGKEKTDPNDYKLFVTSGDEIFFGFRYEDRDGTERWFQQRMHLSGDALFAVMDRHYEKYIDSRYVGEKVYLRVVDPVANRTGDKDTVQVQVTAHSGATMTVQLVETLSHSGIFKGLVEFVHQRDNSALESARFNNGLAVTYGDVVSLSYGGESGIVHTVAISKGSDGTVMPFTKKFKDPDIAMRTIFSIAEAYFEMAKKHRSLAEEAERSGKKDDVARLQRIAREEIRQGRKLLAEAIRDFPENEIRAQADYLRAELALELAKDTELESRKQEYYQEALGLFGDLITRYQDSEYAPKAQFKKALVYEKMGLMDLACAEYVKLSYKYPGSELIAETIARLGNYFLTQGDKLLKESESYQGRDDIKAAEIKLNAKNLFYTAGNVFSKLREHFPEHSLAAQTTVAAGMCMMWAERWQNAHDLLSAVVNDAGDVRPETKAEAYYWLGDTYVRMLAIRDATITIKGATSSFSAASLAYQTFMKLTWEYPDTKWAGYARGQLAGNGALRPPTP